MPTSEQYQASWKSTEGKDPVAMAVGEILAHLRKDADYFRAAVIRYFAQRSIV